MNSIRKAVKYFRGYAKMAAALGIRPDYVYKMAQGRRFPSLKRILAIEKATNGHVSAEEMLHEKLEIIRNTSVETAKE